MREMVMHEIAKVIMELEDGTVISTLNKIGSIDSSYFVRRGK